MNYQLDQSHRIAPWYGSLGRASAVQSHCRLQLYFRITTWMKNSQKSILNSQISGFNPALVQTPACWCLQKRQMADWRTEAEGGGEEFLQLLRPALHSLLPNSISEAIN